MDRYDGMDGIKTGYIRASGFNLVASAHRGSTRLIGVVFGGRSATARDNRMAQLLDESFEEARTGQRAATINNLAQGDANDDDEVGSYVKLPAKIEAVFEPGDDTDIVPVVVTPTGAMQPRNAVSRSTGGWGIQIGAYSDPDIGQQALSNVVRTMPKLLSHATPIVDKVSTGGEAMYRARLMALDQRTAQSVCSWLMHHGQNCMTVQP